PGLTPRARLRHTRAPAGRGGRHMATATVDSIELYYEEHGRGDPLLLIMGLAADSTAWMFQVPDFAERYRTITFDNRGVGRSSKPPGPYTIHQMADDAAGLLDALRVARAHVLGVSMGGMIAQELALRHPERVRGLVLACTYPEPDVEVERQREFGMTQFGGTVTASGEIRIDLSALDPLMFFQHLLPRVFNQSFIDRELPRLMQVFSGALQYGFSMEAILGQVEAVMGHRATDRLHLIEAPTLVITGDADHAEHEAVDVLVNNAGVGLGGGFLDTSLEDWRWILSINLWGVIHGCHFFLPPMVRRGRGGHVVNVSSAAGFLATAQLAAYSATKFAVFGLSEALRDELRPHGIAVTTVCPGIINTPITTSAPMRGPLATPEGRRRRLAAGGVAGEGEGDGRWNRRQDVRAVRQHDDRLGRGNVAQRADDVRVPGPEIRQPDEPEVPALALEAERGVLQHPD